MHDRADPSRPDTGSSQIVLPVGTVLAQSYRVAGILAEPGPHAIVYRATDPSGDEVAVKELFPRALLGRAPGDPTAVPRDADAESRMGDARRRFLLESQLLESITHGGLPAARGHFEANGTAYLVTELVAGPTLEAQLRDGGRMPLADAGRLVLAVLDALEVLHGHGILHRDIAPANILIGTDGQPRLVGLATPRQLLMYGMPGAVAPRAGFAAIEMYGSRGKGPWTDVHAVAALLYLLVTGSLPTPAVDRAAGESLVPPTRLVSGLPWALDGLIVKGLAQRPEERPHSAERFRSMLEEALADGRMATPAFGAGATPSYAPPPTPAYGSAGITPLTVPAVSASNTLPAPFAFPAPHPAQLGDDELITVDEPAGSAVAFDPTGSMMVVPRSESSAKRLLRYGGGALLGALLLWGALRSFRSPDDAEALLSPGSEAVQLPAQVTAAPPVATPVVPPAPTADSQVSQAGTEEAAPAPRREEPRERPREETRIDIPRIRVPVFTAPTPTIATQPVPADVVERLRDDLGAAQARVTAADYAGAQRLFRGAIARIDDVQAKHLPSGALAALRRDLEKASQDARTACTTLNTIAARRNGRVIACE
ncbi:MAG TPA: serine/threonine-protein kinase [Gemmatimonadaceae bacterium]|nr:serine/threonine-protein kinase [Gemmatimonadaceae bacterium]